ncbi:hypothetical protein T07_9551 [Trichinella nelsoni]|uniref:Uncharacterized protein n=1 Tax=Trichinella nelsoni TaxID=6336 RepID=A0A0V0SI44_9BILA|nr:hypothetical protein T07_9551 [Trichinella nelsoni]
MFTQKKTAELPSIIKATKDTNATKDTRTTADHFSDISILNYSKNYSLSVQTRDIINIVWDKEYSKAQINYS